MQWVTDPPFQKMQAAAELARKAIAANPDGVGNWLSLARVLLATGEVQEAAARLREAIRTLPPSAELHLLLVNALHEQDLYEEALFHAETALSIAPSNVGAKRRYLDLLVALQRWDEGVLDSTAAAEFLPTVPNLMAKQAKLLGPERAIELCDAQLATNPAHTNAKYLKAIVLAKLGRPAEAGELINIDRLVEIRELPAPPDYVDDPCFRDALARDIRANPTLTRDPRGASTHDGLLARRLRQPGAVAVDSLLGRFKEAVESYVQRLDVSGDDFAVGRPQRARLVPWATICGRAGRQKVHRHPFGWLSGVYYVAAQRPLGENAYRGPLIIGALDPEAHGVDPPWGTREIEPIPGRLVLFPSYFPHATEPSGIDGARISVAFDVVPADAA
jgi:tetratricopeptide (TPR) repeat protein